MEGITLTPLKLIPGANGKVMHALKSHEEDFHGFGEAYFSTVDFGVAKGWKKHTKMISNLVVPVGEILFVFYDDRENSETLGQFFQVKLSLKNYCRLSVQPGIWMAFKGLGKDLNLLLNISSISHDPEECETMNISNPMINYTF